MTNQKSDNTVIILEQLKTQLKKFAYIIFNCGIKIKIVIA
jgi:hypothetical protein